MGRLRKLGVGALFAAVAVCCGACARPLDEGQVNRMTQAFAGNFTAQAQVVCGENTSKVQLTREGDALTVTYCGEDVLTGMEYRLSPEACTLGYSGIVQPLKGQAQNTPAGQVYLILQRMKDAGNIQMRGADQAYEVTDAGDADFVVTVEPTSGKWQKLVSKELQLEMTFESFEYKS